MNPLDALTMLNFIREYLISVKEHGYVGVLRLNNSTSLEAWRDDNGITQMVINHADNGTAIDTILGDYFNLCRVRFDDGIACVKLVGRNGTITIHDYFEPYLIPTDY